MKSSQEYISWLLFCVHTYPLAVLSYQGSLCKGIRQGGSLIKPILSIIIPAYNAEPYIDQLINKLKPQITDEVEVLVIDDGSRFPYISPYEEIKVVRQENGGASAARNKGLDLARGEYIAFVDADDLVSDDYVPIVLDKIKKEQFDYCYISWEAFGSWRQQVVIKNIDDTFPSWNLCVWNRIYKKSLIGTTRFNLKKLIAEDAEFIRNIEKGKKSYISKILYKYRSDTPNSLTKRFNEGKLKTKRIVYYFDEIKSDMEYLVDEAKAADVDAEVIFLTNKNNLPELEKYAMVMTPRPIKGTELRGQPCSYFTQLELPEEYDVILYMTNGQAIGGIETFIYNFCYFMQKKYSIAVIYNKYDSDQIDRLSKVTKCIKLPIRSKISCKTLIVNRITDAIPGGISYSQVIQMVHTCKMGRYRVPTGRNRTIYVSEAAKKSFGLPGDVIHNFVSVNKPKDPLILVSATRLSYEKGEQRMVTLAKKLNEAKIPFLWLIFTDSEIKDLQKGMAIVKPTLDISSYIRMASYVVQLSDVESFCLILAESLVLNTPVITTDLEVLPELGIEDGVNGYVLPFDMNFDVSKLTHIPKFKYKYDNEVIMDKWTKVLDFKASDDAKMQGDGVRLQVVVNKYYDIEIHQELNRGYRFYTSPERAQVLVSKKMCKYI